MNSIAPIEKNISSQPKRSVDQRFDLKTQALPIAVNDAKKMIPAIGRFSTRFKHER